jgi:hypothetical protein
MSLKCALALSGYAALTCAHAMPTIERATLFVDTTDYNGTYVVGVQAWVNGHSTAISSVVASHQSFTSGAFQPWSLALSPNGYYWDWSNHLERSAGPVDGSISLTVTDVNGGVFATSDLRFKPEAEIEIPMMTVSQAMSGYRVQTGNVTGADYYTLWLWDPVDRFYPSSQQVTDVANFSYVPFAGLVDGRTYRLFLSAYNPFTAGTLDTGDLSTFRSTTATNLMFSVSPVPEPPTSLLLLVGLGLLAYRYRAAGKSRPRHLFVPGRCGPQNL